MKTKQPYFALKALELFQLYRETFMKALKADESEKRLVLSSDIPYGKQFQSF